MSFQLVGNIRGPAGPPGGGGADLVWIGLDAPEPRGDHVLWIRQSDPGHPEIPVPAEITVVGTTSGAANNVALPTHQAGDMLIFAARGTAAPTIPGTSGTVGPWTQIQGGAAANSLAMVTAWQIASGPGRTSGTWTNANQVACMVLRGNAALSAGPSATGNANNTGNIVYPALSGVITNGTSMGVRFGTRGTASEIAPPPGWTNQVRQPTGTGALLAIHTMAELSANIAAATVTQAGTTPYRAHTFEVRIGTPTPIPPHPPTLAGFFKWVDDRWVEVGPPPAVGPDAPLDPEVGAIWVDTSE